MKVLHILNALEHSGAEVELQLAYDRFKSSGIESHILSTGEQVGDYAIVLERTGYIIHHIPFRKNIRFLINIIKLFKTEKFTAVHIHCERVFIWYVLMAKLAGVQTVVRTFHNVFIFSSYLRWKKQIHRKVSRGFFGTVHTAVSDSVLAIEKERFQNDCILNRNWTDVDKFRPSSGKERAQARHLYHLKPDDFVIVTIGKCTSIKNHLAIFSAVKKANDILERKKRVVLHVGTGPMISDEEIYVRQHHIEQYCQFIGTLNDVRPCLYAADAFVMTSRWEGLPIAAVEAMSTGLPTILYNVYGLRDLLQGTEAGLLIEPNEDCLVESLLLMIRSPELCKVKAQEARKHILRTYSLGDSVERFIHFYTNGSCQ